jgi:hypothetical protein
MQKNQKIKAPEKMAKNAFMHLPKMKSKALLNNSIGRICTSAFSNSLASFSA